MKSGISLNITVSLGSLALTALAIGAGAALALTATRKPAKPQIKAQPPGVFGQYGKDRPRPAHATPTERAQAFADAAMKRAMAHGAKVAKESFEARTGGKE